MKKNNLDDEFIFLSEKEIQEIINSKKDSKFNAEFNFLLEPYFDPGDIFFDFFWEFSYRMQSLQRYFEYTDRFINEYIKNFEKYYVDLEQNNNYAEEIDLGGEQLLSDKNYFQEQHYSAILANLFSLLETLLSEVTNDVAKTLNKEFKIEKRMSYIDKYLYFLDKGCGLNVSIEKETWHRLELMRNIRNKYIHNLGKNISNYIKSELLKLYENNNEEEFKLNYEFINLAFETIANIAFELRDSYFRFYDSANK
ncbi:methionine synthase II (cobalamin-independent) [Acetoanaerobium pronyense]|uniref:Methionine synthase II (Cobalamin-independent) n=1 Tax=Acetoanaerobium pronyense TaxID=1482736 RepID=A0ABS4KPX1_9FIRM|nr:hypothetical protein [Acetoanaerobium pronyense]MBP2028654.1 methionine synthase II (cobalamin-independent) [Acetoanaerobium pronyense]